MPTKSALAEDNHEVCSIGDDGLSNPRYPRLAIWRALIRVRQWRGRGSLASRSRYTLRHYLHPSRADTTAGKLAGRRDLSQYIWLMAPVVFISECSLTEECQSFSEYHRDC